MLMLGITFFANCTTSSNIGHNVACLSAGAGAVCEVCAEYYHDNGGFVMITFPHSLPLHPEY